VAVVRAAGVSAATAAARKILEVDLLGTAHVTDAFGAVAGAGTSTVCVASMTGHYARLTPAEESAPATAPTDTLLALESVTWLDGPAADQYIDADRCHGGSSPPTGTGRF
jgi:hypothetical protein